MRLLAASRLSTGVHRVRLHHVDGLCHAEITGVLLLASLMTTAMIAHFEISETLRFTNYLFLGI